MLKATVKEAVIYQPLSVLRRLILLAKKQVSEANCLLGAEGKNYAQATLSDRAILLQNK